MAGHSQEVRNNVIENCAVGVYLIGNLWDSTFSENNIVSNMPDSKGYRNINNAQNNRNILISNETISVQKRPLDLYVLNEGSDLSTAQISVKNCILNSAKTSWDHTNFIKKSKNITLEGNVSNTEFEVVDSENIVLINNTVTN